MVRKNQVALATSGDQGVNAHSMFKRKDQKSSMAELKATVAKKAESETILFH